MPISKSNSQLVVLKDELWLKRQKHAGQAIAKSFQLCDQALKSENKISSKDLESIVSKQLEEYDCVPTFLGYKGYPAKICASVNKSLVHGIPNNSPLSSGDVITIDVGATYEGAIADAAFTYIYQESKNPLIPEMLQACYNVLYKAIESIKVGNNIGIIGNTIYNNIRKTKFGLIIDYGGHGLDYNILHSSPFIANKSKESDGIRIQPGLSIAIEPMLVLGKNINTRVLADKWTITTANISCHFEHSVTLDENGRVHIITDHGLKI